MENTKKSYIGALIPSALCILLAFSSCNNPDNRNSTEIGPVKNIELNKELDKNLIEQGKFIFTKKCMECHNLDIRAEGPTLRDVTKRRKAEWIMNMILNTEQMIKEDSIARSLFNTHVVKMVVKDVSEQDSRAVLEYLRSVETK